MIAMASRPSGMLIQKISDQCRCSAKVPPSSGPAMLATAQVPAIQAA